MEFPMSNKTWFLLAMASLSMCAVFAAEGDDENKEQNVELCDCTHLDEEPKEEPKAEEAQR